MALKEKNISIGTVNAIVYKLPFGQSVKVVDKMRKLFAPVMKAMAATGKSENDQLEALADAIGEAMTSMEDGALTGFIEEVLTSGFVAVNGRKISSLGDLDAIEDEEPLYVGLELVKEQIQFSIVPGMGKLLGGRAL
jgi:uncharacterized protein with von Willebrand factor type A (vWA) domain